MSARTCFDCSEPVTDDEDDLVTYTDGTVEHGACFVEQEQFVEDALAAGYTVTEHANGAVGIAS